MNDRMPRPPLQSPEERKERQRESNRLATRNRVARARANGLKATIFIIPDEAVALLDELKALRGYKNRNEAASLVLGAVAMNRHLWKELGL